MAAEANKSPSLSDTMESRQAAMRNRIITHLNDDHAFSLQMYLRHFCAVPQQQALNAKITDITTDHMIIESRAGRNLIPLDPPMKSLMETRERTVAMHRQALAGLGLSNTRINTFALPNKPWQVGICAIVVWCLTSLPFRSQLPPSSGSWISQIWSVGGLIPGLATLAYKLAPFSLAFIYVLHTIEAENFARTRLRKHQVPMGSVIWCLWVVYAFIGGIACFTRFDELVKEKEDHAKKNEKH